MVWPDDRKIKILDMIAASDTYVTGKAISLALNISVRTVQAEVAAINKETNAVLSSNRGYLLNRDADTSALHTETRQKLLGSKEAILEHALLKHVIMTDASLQVDELAEDHFISTSLLEKKLNILSVKLQSFGLKLEREKRYIKVIGDELSKRKIIRQLIYDEIPEGSGHKAMLMAYFKNIAVDRIEEIILKSIQTEDCGIDQTYLNTLLTNVVIAVYRAKMDIGKETGSYVKRKEGTKEYRIAKKICLSCRDELQAGMTEKDTEYIALQMEGCIRMEKMTAKEHPALGQEDDMFLQKENDIDTCKEDTNQEVPDFVNEYIDRTDILPKGFMDELYTILLSVFNYYMLDIHDKDFLPSFALHVMGMLQRTGNAQPAEDDLYQSVKRTSPFIHDVSVSIARKIGERYHVMVPDAEIGYICIHLGYLIEKAVWSTIFKAHRIHVLLYGSEYQQVQNNLAQKLLDNFSDLIELLVYKENGEGSLFLSSTDLVITTKPMHFIGKPVLLISPFYSMMDHLAIDKAVHNLLQKREKEQHGRLLASFFHEKLFFRNKKLNEKEEVIGFLGEQLEAFGVAAEGFTESVMKREALSSTCFFDTFAIPHALDMNARQTMVGVYISEKGIKWNDSLIHVVLMIAVDQKDRKQFMEVYNGLVRIFEKPELVRMLVLSDTHEEFLNRLIEMNMI